MSLTLTRSEIEQRIPHRPPFLWIDEVTALDESRITAKTFLDPAWELFGGHYPGSPVFPGVLQCEAAFQAGAVLMSQLLEPGSARVPVVTRLNNTQFRQLVRPGETLTIDVELTERLANAFLLGGKITVAGKVTCRLEFTVTTVPQIS